ncbi:MAG: pentapeptide repeat-containing protein [Chloroflexota bacterium]
MDWTSAFTEDPVTLIATVASAIATVAAAIIAWIALRPQRENKQKQRLLAKEFGSELFPAYVIERSTRFYVEPDCANVDPSREAEIRHTKATKQPLFGVLDDFFEGESIYRHMIILADSGMGKTSALLNYYVHNQQRHANKHHHIVVIPLGIPDVEAEIEAIPDPQKTILFLDAFDEDTKALQDHKARLMHLMESCKRFSHIVITCRTQFFPDDEEIPKETGIVRIGPRAGNEGKHYTFQKIYIQPLTDAQADTYLNKRYPFWQSIKRWEAKRVVDKIPNLRVRPMLLDSIPDLLNANEIQLAYSFQLYEALVNAWLERERGWVEPEILWQFSTRLAVDLHVNKKKRGAEHIPRSELLSLAQEWDINLEGWQIAGRSLLNRDAEGNYKFAHRSIMEYLFLRANTTLLELEINWNGIELTDPMQRFINEMVSYQQYVLLHNLPNVVFSEVNLENADFEDANLEGARFIRANLKKANLNGTSLIRSNLKWANLAGGNLKRASIKWANLEGSNLEGANLYGANLDNANLYQANLNQAILKEANLKGTNLDAAMLDGAILVQCRYGEYTKWPSGFDYKNSGALGPYANLRRSNLGKANLNQAELNQANLLEANLNQADLGRANLNQANLKRATLEGANLQLTDLSEANLSGAILSNAVLYKAILEGTILVDTFLQEAVLEGASLEGANLEGANLYRTNLQGASLEGSNLYEAILYEANLYEANLEGANLEGAILEHSILNRAKYDDYTKWPAGFHYQSSGAIGPNAELEGANLKGANLYRANLTGANLAQTDLEGVRLEGARYDNYTKWPSNFNYQTSGAIGPNADLSEAILRYVDLSGIDLSEANLSGANLREAFYNNKTKWPEGFDYRKSGAIGPNADLSGAILRFTDMSGVDLSGAILSGARYDRNTRWPNGFDYRRSGAIGPNADLSGKDLSEVKLNGTDLTGADMKGTDLNRANLSGADLTQVDLSEASLQWTIYDSNTKWPNGFGYRKSGAIGPNADLSGADLSGADLSGADLSGADLSGADLSGADLRGTDLSRASLSRANLNHAIYDSHIKWPEGFDYRKLGALGPDADLRGMDLKGTDLRGADLRGADLSRADLSRADLRRVNLDQANLNRANLNETNLIGANLNGANLSEAILSEVDLRLTRYNGNTKWPDGFDPMKKIRFQQNNPE